MDLAEGVLRALCLQALGQVLAYPNFLLYKTLTSLKWSVAQHMFIVFHTVKLHRLVEAN